MSENRNAMQSFFSFRLSAIAGRNSLCRGVKMDTALRWRQQSAAWHLGAFLVKHFGSSLAVQARCARFEVRCVSVEPPAQDCSPPPPPPHSVPASAAAAATNSRAATRRAVISKLGFMHMRPRPDAPHGYEDRGCDATELASRFSCTFRCPPMVRRLLYDRCCNRAARGRAKPHMRRRAATVYAAAVRLPPL